MLTVEDICQRLKVCRSTVCNWCRPDKSGKPQLPNFRAGTVIRVREEDLEAFIASRFAK